MARSFKPGTVSRTVEAPRTFRHSAVDRAVSTARGAASTRTRHEGDVLARGLVAGVVRAEDGPETCPASSATSAEPKVVIIRGFL